MLTTISDGKMAALCVGGLFAFMGVWAGLLLWVGRDFDSHAEAFRKTYREGTPVETPKDSK
jgi:hypothetical protein